MQIEAVVLTGGASTRMGQDKATLSVGGTLLAVHIATELSKVCEPVTICGREPVAGFPFLADDLESHCPLVALSRFGPTRPLVFVASCDLPLYDSSVVADLAARIGDLQAAVPTVEGR